LVLELGVLVVEDLVICDAEDLAGGFEFGAAGVAELLVAGGVAAIGRRLTICEAEDGGFDAARGGERERAAEGEAFVVGMSGDAEEAEGHGWIIAGGVLVGSEFVGSVEGRRVGMRFALRQRQKQIPCGDDNMKSKNKKQRQRQKQVLRCAQDDN
jgi:hypothetical protein